MEVLRREQFLDVGKLNGVGGGDDRDHRHRERAAEQLQPVDASKDWMARDFGRAARAAQPRVRLVLHQLPQRVMSAVRQVGGQRQLRAQHLSVDLDGLVCTKRREAEEKLVQKHAQRPEIDLSPIPAAREHLRSGVLGCAAYCPRALGAMPQVRGETEVEQHQVAAPVDHEVLGLQIAMHPPPRVHVVQRAERHRRVERGCARRESLRLSQRVEELQPADRF
mmetsp:Transcript_27733/g.64726  ORF Transcript_27733/g.64726 Transcript_27733/m.64726 type:complete len:222 (+) Transcript_27733:456-1121(+)